MQKWEYTIATAFINYKSTKKVEYSFTFKEKTYPDCDTMLNEIGSQGWELVNSVPINAPVDITLSQSLNITKIEACTNLVNYYFKRPFLEIREPVDPMNLNNQ